jgi:ArsR family transcriptional regulator
MNCLSHFKALADETRIRLLNILMHNELNVNEIVSLMAMGQPRISRHLKVLTDSGLLNCRRDGTWAFYSASGEIAVGRFLDSLRPFFQAEPRLAEDLENAARLIAERRRHTRNFFNSIAAEWNDLQQEMLGDFDLNRAILDCVQGARFAVDLGCGTGELLAGLREKVDFAVGVDSSRNMLDQAEKLFSRNKTNVELRLGELEHLPLENGEADLAILSMVLHHLAKPEKAAAEASRILKKNGIFIIADFEKHTNEEMRKKFGDRWLGFSEDEIRILLENSGFMVQEIKTFPLEKSIHLNITIARKK